MKQKIALVANTSWYIYNFRLDLIGFLQDKGYAIIVIAPDDKYSKYLEDNNCSYFHVNMDGKGKSIWKDVKTLFSIYKLYRYSKPDIILHFTIKPNVYGSIAARILKVPVINNIAGLGTLFVKRNVFTLLAIMLYRFSQKKADYIFFQNQDDYNLFIESKILNKQKYRILPGSGVDLKKFNVSNFKKIQPISPFF